MNTPPQISPCSLPASPRQAGGSPAGELAGRAAPLPRRSPSRAAAEHVLEEEILRAVALHLRDGGGEGH